MTPEAKVKKTVKKILDDRGAYYFMPATGGYGRSGVPDIVGCHKGIFFGIECKAGDNQPTALQLRELDKIQMHEGYIAIISEKNLIQVEVMLDCIEAENAISEN
jgi:Holliday junction resolvase